MASQQFLDDELLQRRIEKFYGYGNYEGKYWFVGMEEAGGETFADINCRMNTWAKREHQEIDDIAEYEQDRGWWDEKIQNTWKGLIRITLSANGKDNIDVQDVKKYQFCELGRKNKETCLLELLPLPSPSIDDWIYAKHSQLPFLSDRETYKNYCIENRINHISQRIKEHKPKAVVFYGMKYEDSWRKIANVEFTKIEFSQTEDSKKHYFFIGKNNHTIFVMVKHSVAFGVTNDYFHYIGKSIVAKLAE
ncbi:hypothetical protein A0J48_020410 [Sphaerospermopsis aphanizomenoides BCCUSP55]|uniref:hypothetical protein n=1 Tax=Sphaerospermopsis aphanizomenoides TaxID=459663 RepID=UPI001908B8BE|nr:hypothetical protein [Sphaerospermopsis aphanizomenoides]MBK1989863.1 hypothetical protein [Sphaerospermopsis aphanizomenoides BCCUSP55]